MTDVNDGNRASTIAVETEEQVANKNDENCAVSTVKEEKEEAEQEEKSNKNDIQETISENEELLETVEQIAKEKEDSKEINATVEKKRLFDQFLVPERTSAKKRKSDACSSTSSNTFSASSFSASSASSSALTARAKRSKMQKKRVDANKQKGRVAEKEVEEIEDVDEKRICDAEIVRRFGTELQAWPEEALATVVEGVLHVAREYGFEFEAMCTMAMLCKSVSRLLALSPASASVQLVQRYADAFFRERVTIRKFEIDQTPTKQSLEPYYQFAEEFRRGGFGAERGAGEESLAGDDHQNNAEAGENSFFSSHSRSTFTLTAPCVHQCLKGVKGIPAFALSKNPLFPWRQNVDTSSEWERVKTKNWEIRNPLFRLVSIYAQSHATCVHAARFHEWVARVKTWSLARERKPWAELREWHDKPPTLRIPSIDNLE